jgi:hypothetical protein
MTIELMKQWLEALECIFASTHPYRGDESTFTDEASVLGDNAITSLRQAIEQAEKQEPVAYQDIAEKCRLETVPAKGTLLHTSPPAAQRQPLTEEQIDDIWNRYCDEMGEASINDAYDIARAIEAAHGIGEKK